MIGNKNPASRWKRDFFGSGGIKIGLFVPAALASFGATRAVTGEFNVGGLALFTLIASIPLLLPFGDLGLGGTLTQAVAAAPGDRETILRAYRSIALRLSLVAGGLILLTVAMSALDLWPNVLGTTEKDAANAAALVLVLFALTLPASLGYRLLLGLQQNRTVILLQSSSGILGSVLVIALASAGAGLTIICIAPTGAGLVFAGIGTLRALQSMPRPRAKAEPNRSWQFSYGTSAAFLIIAVSAPITFQTDRILLANQSTQEQLAQYGAVFQLYGPGYALLIAVGQTLWPRFAALAVQDPSALKKSFLLVTALFTTLGVLGGTTLVLIGPIITNWVTNGLVEPSMPLLIGFGMLFLVNAMLYPAGMLMVGGSAVRIQAVCALLTAVAKVVLALSIFADRGATGMLLSTLSALIVCAGVPVSIYIWNWLFKHNSND